MSTTNFDIINALSERLTSSEICTLYPVAFPGVVFEPDVERFLAVSFHFAPTVQVTVGDVGFDRSTGFMRINVQWLSGDGVKQPMLLAGEVLELFRRGTAMQSNGVWTRIIQPPFISDPLINGGWVQVPVTIRWQSDNQGVQP